MMKSIDIRTVGYWKLYYKAWDGTRHRKVVRKLDRSVDIVLADGRYRIYNKYPISSLPLYYKSESIHEPRPYYYYADLEDVQRLFPSLDLSLVKELDDRYYVL